MARWKDLADREPVFAAMVAELLDARRHKTIATLRKDGSPRTSGIETMLVDGDLYIGSMAGARKADDLGRDPRFALQCSTDDPPEGEPSRWRGDVALSGRAVEIEDASEVRRVMAAAGHPVGESEDDDSEVDESEQDDSHLYRLDLAEVVWVRVSPDEKYLEIQTWHPGRGLERIERH